MLCGLHRVPVLQGAKLRLGAVDMVDRRVLALALAITATSGAHAYTANGAFQLRAVSLPAGRRDEAFCRSHTRVLFRTPGTARAAPLLSGSAGMPLDGDGESEGNRSVSAPLSADRMAKLKQYAEVFAEDGVNGDMRKFNVIKVAHGREVETVNMRDRLSKIARYTDLFSQPMSGTARTAAVRRIDDGAC